MGGGCQRVRLDVDVIVIGATATLDQVVVRGTSVASGGVWGEGIAAWFGEVIGDTQVMMSHVLLEENARAGIALGGATGTLAGSTIRRNVFAVLTDEGGEIEMAGDNAVFDNEQDEVTSADIEPPPVVDPIPP